MQHRKCSLYMWAFIFWSYLVLGNGKTVVEVHFTSKEEGWEVRGGNAYWMSMYLSILVPKCWAALSVWVEHQSTQHGREAACVECAGSGDRCAPSQLMGSVLQHWDPTEAEFSSWEGAKPFITFVRAQNTHRLSLIQWAVCWKCEFPVWEVGRLDHYGLSCRELKTKLWQDLSGSVSHAVTKISQRCPPNSSHLLSPSLGTIACSAACGWAHWHHLREQTPRAWKFSLSVLVHLLPLSLCAQCGDKGSVLWWCHLAFQRAGDCSTAQSGSTGVLQKIWHQTLF